MNNKKIIYKYRVDLRIIFSVMVAAMLASCSQTASNVSDNQEPIVLDSTLMMPDFSIFTIEDSSTFTSSSISKNGIILLKYFSPDCNHCQDEAKIYVSKKDSLKNIRTIWVSGDWAPLDSIRKFVDTYQLSQVEPIAIGKEANNFLLSNYKIEGIPYNAVFKDNQLIKEYSHLDFSELITINNGDFAADSVDLVESN